MEARSAKPKQNDGLIVEQCARYDSAQSRRLARSSTTAEGMDAKVSGWRAQYVTSTALQTTKVPEANSFPRRWMSRRRGSRLAAFRSCTNLIAKAIPETTAMTRENKSCSKSNVKSNPARHEDATMGPRSASLHGLDNSVMLGSTATCLLWSFERRSIFVFIVMVSVESLNNSLQMCEIEIIGV